MAKKKTIIIFGADGMLGQEFVNFFKKDRDYKVLTLNKKQADITNREQVSRIIKKHQPQIAINCAALINVNKCEAEPLLAWRVNALGPGNIAAALRDLKNKNVIFLQISTSDVFGNTNKKSFLPTDNPAPVNVYGWSKLAGEQLAAAVARAGGYKYFIVRTSWLYSLYRDTFVDLAAQSLINKKEVDIISDQFNTVTWTRDLVRGVNRLLAHKQIRNGIYHLVNKAPADLNKYKISLEIARALKLEKKYLKKSGKGDILKVIRPLRAVLTPSKIISLPNWQQSLVEYLRIKYGTK